jgi:hypothetical protein
MTKSLPGVRAGDETGVQQFGGGRDVDVLTVLLNSCVEVHDPVVEAGGRRLIVNVEAEADAVDVGAEKIRAELVHLGICHARMVLGGYRQSRRVQTLLQLCGTG